MLRRGRQVAMAALVAPITPAWADPGVTDTEIVIGSRAAPARLLGTQTVVGARAYLTPSTSSTTRHQVTGSRPC